jgi:hypothetical protein
LIENILVSKSIIKQLKELKTEESCFIYGKDKFTKIFKCRNKQLEKDIFKVILPDLIKFFVKFVFGRNNALCFCHVHSKFKGLSTTDCNNMINGFFYIIIYKKELFVYLKRKDVVYKNEYKVREING